MIIEAYNVLLSFICVDFNWRGIIKSNNRAGCLVCRLLRAVFGGESNLCGFSERNQYSECPTAG